MTYPPPGGYDPRQYQPGSQPQPPSDPYSQGYGGAPPPPSYGFDQPVQYSQQPSLPPNMTPPVGVQPGYPSAPGAPLPPPIPPARQGGGLGVILAVVIGLVVVLGVAAVLLVPGLLADEPNADSGTETSASPTADEESDEAGSDPGSGGSDESAVMEGWSEPVNSEDYDPNTPEGAAIEWSLAADSGDASTMDSLMCSDPSDELMWEYEYYTEGTPYDFGWVVWGMWREVDGEIQAWASWTVSDGPPTEEDVYQAYIMVEEGGAWKVCGLVYLF